MAIVFYKDFEKQFEMLTSKELQLKLKDENVKKKIKSYIYI